MSQHTTANLADLMAKRRKCLVQLREIGVKQGELIAAGNMSDLLRLFGGKQQLIAALQAIEAQLAPYHADDPAARQWASVAARDACAADADACRQLIQEVMAMELAGEQQMTARRNDVAQQLRSMTAGSRVREAYQAQEAGAVKSV
jgi:hypothetical protein